MPPPEEETPAPQKRESPHREAIVALQNLSISLNGYSARMATLARTVGHAGLSHEARTTIGGDLRALGAELRATAEVIDPQPASLGSLR